ncbi:MAG: type IX secretion system membrane protein PorP/SprF [Flavobacteriales bacterium]|nr:type IX secretion system membrane protein PorP/SprF [Flavobacteriales bacterium]
MNSNKLVAICSFFLLSGFVFAQESLPFYLQYLISDKVVINPSYTGATDYWVVKGTYNKHWGNFEGGPNTQTFSTHVNAFDRVGIGMMFFRDENGPVSLNGVNTSVAYHIPIGNDYTRKDQFSFGTSLSLFNQHYDRSQLNPETFDDSALQDGNQNIFLPYINLGLSASYRGLFGGVSVTDIPIGNNRPIVNTVEPLPTWYYFNLGYEYVFADNLALEPSVLMNINENSERQLDLNIKGKYFDDENVFAIGFSYRQDMDETGSQSLVMAPFIEAEVGRLNFGFAYTMGLTDISREGGNGFLLGLGYNIENIINSRGFRYR